ncbi:MAG TPA: Ig-like domain-containing protein [Pirellulales bacterium]|nr:Ig-like domain-containing protein [Pirellulales bacterium]
MTIAATVTDIVLGPCLITTGSGVLGFTEGDVTIAYTRGIKVVKSGNEPGPITLIQSSGDQDLHVTGKLLDTLDGEKLVLLYPEMVQSGESLKIGRNGGHYITDHVTALTIHRISDGDTVTYDWHVYKAMNVADMSMGFGDEVSSLDFDFVAIADTTKDDGNLLADRGVAVDAVAPTLTSITPADGASAQLATVNIVVVFSEAMSLNSLVDSSGQCRCAVVLDVTNEAYVACAASVSTTTNANDTLTLNPDASLTAGAEIHTIISETARDLVGNSFAGADYEFAVSA